MKQVLNILLIFCFSTLSAFGQAKNYNPIKVDVGTILPAKFGTSTYYGIGGYFQPKFNYQDNVSLGIRAEWAALFTGSASNTGGSIGIIVASSYQLTGEYYLSNSSTRPFAGMGLGYYDWASVGQSASVDTTNVGVSQSAFVGSGFGLAPQVGIYFGAFRLAGTFNLVMAKSKASVNQTVGAGGVSQSASEGESEVQTYVGLDIGFTFGGARKKE